MSGNGGEAQACRFPLSPVDQPRHLPLSPSGARGLITDKEFCMPKNTAPKKPPPATPAPFKERAKIAIVPEFSPLELTQLELRLLTGFRKLNKADYRTMMVDLVEVTAVDQSPHAAPRLRLIVGGAK
jgi:hypothetical protein